MQFYFSDFGFLSFMIISSIFIRSSTFYAYFIIKIGNCNLKAKFILFRIVKGKVAEIDPVQCEHEQEFRCVSGITCFTSGAT